MLLEDFSPQTAIVFESEDWKSRYPNVVFDQGDSVVIVDDDQSANYVAVMHLGKTVGKLTTRGTQRVNGERYTLIGLAEIDRKFRGQGLGLLMYKALLAHISTRGIASYLPDRSNKQQVPAIYQRLGGEIVDGDWAIIPKP
jgi:ribosomal protein S18 acetylase RimI-like enzyme